MRPYIPRQEFRQVVTGLTTPAEDDVLAKLPSPWRENATNLLAKDPTKIDAPTLTSAKNMYNLFKSVPSDSPDFSTYMAAAEVLKGFIHQADPTNPLFAVKDIFPTDTSAKGGVTKLGIGTVIPSVGTKGNTKPDPNVPAGTLPAPPEPQNPDSIWNSNITKGVAIAGVALLAGVAIAKMS